VISERTVGDVTILELKGDFRTYCFYCGEWSGPYNRARALIDEGKNPKVLLDLTHATGLGLEAALGELVVTMGVLSKNGGQLKLIRPPKDLVVLLDDSKLLSAFEIFDDVNGALQSFKS
jgi:anti-anti-sigma regulatory factor